MSVLQGARGEAIERATFAGRGALVKHCLRTFRGFCGAARGPIGRLRLGIAEDSTGQPFTTGAAFLSLNDLVLLFKAL